MPVKSTPNTSKLFTLRFRAKIILGFVAVLAILAVSMAFAYFGFERIQAAVASYRASVSEADLARTVDRELIAYQGLARAYTLTGATDDETAANQPQLVAPWFGGERLGGERRNAVPSPALRG